ncbi:hypothetical protein [Cryobacterium sp. Hz7]|uniref:hypothetical protein n=1 Tax=Cryobacterium sp. Hz7 TaxID=1259166 RepID=UPI00141BE7B9|nr:hypothetical protein [Cryobacterium sp. Hz7]
MNRNETAMARLLKYIPVILTVVTKYLRSPQGKAAMQKVRSSRRRPKNVGSTRPGY